ncbi:hypothetical protein BDN72DRAFT_789083 [Pluteus cervinus]|uniref:Uncharacterized protein n=1 Tax=Pluteus cervinus TaxID=181527 RepID=A0ACD3B8J3_9AGAR|nr:hypothetical protein BDN72DRAFT_789083 [Pluteus cervinus]
MSWSGSYPPTSRRSRSRSPSRPYPARPYPDVPYPQDTYRPEWDGYDRDRSWASYERDRAAYDYGRRGRSRSPPMDEPNRKRRRSLSPYERDRYEPRLKYSGDEYDPSTRSHVDPSTRSHGYSPPRRSYPAPYPPSRRAPPDPHTFDYPATLKQYAEWFRYFYPQQAIDEDNADKAAEQEAGDGSKPRNGIKTRWEKYKKDFAATQLQTMFDHHRKSPWFAEKYDPAPEFVNLRTRIRKEGWRGRIDAFLVDLENGKFDPDLNETEAEPTSPVKESAVGDHASGETNGAGTNAEDPKHGDDDIQFPVDGDDDPVDTDAGRQDTNGKALQDSKRGSRGEEVSAQPEGNQVMIRTIPPDIGRVKLEEACGKIPGFVYIALGDPLQKRNFYRAGWLKFADDADMPTVMTELAEKKIEGFKLHVTHNTRPFVNKVRYAPEVASRPERLEKDLVNAKTLAGILEEEAARVRKAKFKLIDGKTVGESAPEDEAATNGAEFEDEDDAEPKERGSDAVERRIEKIMADLRDQGLVDVNDEGAYDAKKTVISLDLYLAYLRAAFHTCYYCSVVTDHLEELQRKCLKHVRKPLPQFMLDETKAAESEKDRKDEEGDEKESGEKESQMKKDGQNKDRDWKRNDERWLEWLDSKVALLINRNGVDPHDYGGKGPDEELSKAVEPFIKQEDEGKFRCKQCSKLFKATSFVEKHVANKHGELVKSLEEIPYFNNFALDPHRIQPFAHPPAPTGNSSQVPPPQAYGIQGPPPAFYGGEYGRPPPHYGAYPTAGYPPAPPYHNGHWEHYPNYGAGGPFGGPGGFGMPVPPPPRRDEATIARKLSDRISGYAHGSETSTSAIPAAAGLPPKPSAAALDSALGSNGNGGGGGNRRNNRHSTNQNGPAPPPPPDAKEDPRAAAGKRVSYHDMDLVAEGDVELSY